MSFGVLQQLTESTVIDACLVSSFTSVDATNLILLLGDHLRSYHVSEQGQLIFDFDVRLYGRPEALCSFKPSPGSADHLALVFRKGHYLSVIKYDAEFGDIQTCGQHQLVPAEDPKALSGPSGFQPQLAADPQHRCIAARVLLDRVVVFPVSPAGWHTVEAPSHTPSSALSCYRHGDHSPGLGAPFAISSDVAPLRLHHLEQIVFLHGYCEPTLACLGKVHPSWGGCLGSSNQRNTSVLVVMVDLKERAPHLIWSMHGLLHDVFAILPLLPPAGGLLALAKNAVIYMKEHGTSFCQVLNPAAMAGAEVCSLKMCVKDDSALKIDLAGCVATVISSSSALISTRSSGRLYLANLVLSTMDNVSNIVWTSPASASPAVGLCTLTEEFIFLAAIAQGSALLRVHTSRKKLPASLQSQRKRPRLDAGSSASRAELDSKEEGIAAANGNSEGSVAANGHSNDGTQSRELQALTNLHAQLSEEARFVHTYTLAVADGLHLFGPLQSMVCWGSGGLQDSSDEGEEPLCGTQRLLCCSGASSRGHLYVMQRALPLESLVDFPIGQGFGAVWSFRAPFEAAITAVAEGTNPVAASEQSAREQALAAEREIRHSFVLLSGSSTSKVLQTTDSIAEISKACPLDCAVPTVCAGNLLQDKLVVQVTASRMLFARSDSPKAEGPSPLAFAPLPASVKQESIEGHASDERQPHAVGGAVCDPYIVVIFNGGLLRLYCCKSDTDVEDLSEQLPVAARSPVVCVSLLRWRASRTLLTVVTPNGKGCLRIFDVGDMKQVFRSDHIGNVPAVLRQCGDPSASSGSNSNAAGDHMRAITDACTQPPSESLDGDGSKNPDGPAGLGRTQATPSDTIIRAELVDLDPGDLGPTLVVVVLGRPILIYRSFIPAIAPAWALPFPYHFRLIQHSFVSSVEHLPSSAYVAVACFPSGIGSKSGPVGAAVSPPHAGMPTLWLTAKRNQLFVHPFPGLHTRSVAPLSAACCEKGFFSLVESGDGNISVQVSALATMAGLPEAQASFELAAPIPHVQVALQRRPQLAAASSPKDGFLGLAVSDTIEESQEPPADDDPLGDEPSIVRIPPVEASTPPLPRLQPRYELWIDHAKDLGNLGQYRFSFDADEHVLSMAWVTLTGFPSPSLVVGTGLNVGEDLTSRGRVLIFSTKDRDPGIIPAVYQRSQKWPVTVVGQWNSYLIVSEGYKLYFEEWDKNSFTKVAFFDGSMYITTLSCIKSFLLVGDLRKGVDFVQWKEDSQTQLKSLRRLSRSSPSNHMAVLACDFVVCQKSLGLVAVDSVGSVHLLQYSAHSDGREGDQLLRSRASFALGSPCRAALRLQVEPGVQSLFLASSTGALLCLLPIDDQVYRTVVTVCGIVATRLPFRCGLNPRAFRSHCPARSTLIAHRKNIEDAMLLQDFLFLSTPLQASIAEKMHLSVDELRQAAVPSATCQLLALTPSSPSGGPAALKDAQPPTS